MTYNLKTRLVALGKRQNPDLKDALAKKGIYASAPEISDAILEKSNAPKSIEIRNESKKILNEWEKYK